MRATWLAVTVSHSVETEHFHHRIGSHWTLLLWTICLLFLSHLFILLYRDGRILAAGGKSNHLHLWCLEAKQLFRIIQMPAKVRAVRHLEFLPDSFDAGSNQVSDTNAGCSMCWKELYQFLSYNSPLIYLFPDCYKDLTLLIDDLPIHSPQPML